MKEKDKINYYSSIKNINYFENAQDKNLKKYNVKLSNNTINKIIDDYY